MLRASCASLQPAQHAQAGDETINEKLHISRPCSAGNCEAWEHDAASKRLTIAPTAATWPEVIKQIHTNTDRGSL